MRLKFLTQNITRIVRISRVCYLSPSVSDIFVLSSILLYYDRRPINFT